MAGQSELHPPSIPERGTGILSANALGRIALVAALYAVVSAVGPRQPFAPAAQLSPVFPAAGLAIAAVLLGGRWLAVGIALGSLFANLPPLVGSGRPFAGGVCALLIAGVAAGQALLGGWLFRRVGGADPYSSLRSALVWIALPSLVVSLTSSLLGPLILCASGFAPLEGWVNSWFSWWLGDASGVLLVGPFVLAWLGPLVRAKRLVESQSEAGRPAEVFLLLLLAAGVFRVGMKTNCAVEYLYLPLICWAGFRFGPRGALTLSCLVAILAILSTRQGRSSFVGNSPEQSLVLVQAFLTTVASCTLLLLGAIAQRNETERQLRESAKGVEACLEERTAELATLNARIHYLEDRDGLTGLPNRRAFDLWLREYWFATAREGHPLSVILVNIDHFKAFNDGQGHPAGDGCLRQVADTLHGALRPTDHLARFGGEEFVALLPRTPLEQAVALAECLRQRVEARRIPHHQSRTGCVTVSAGVACVLAARGGSPESLLSQASDALHAAKHAGRNRVARA